MRPFQIRLPADLRLLIDVQRKKTGESLGAFMRSAIKARVEKERTKQKADFPMKDIRIIVPK